MEVQSLADMCLAHIQLLLNMIIIIIVGRGRFHLGKRPKNKDTLFRKGPRDRTLILKFEEKEDGRFVVRERKIFGGGKSDLTKGAGIFHSASQSKEG